jgi:hypothetical protein
MLAMRESPKERMPLLNKALVILGEPQTPFVTAVMQIPLELYCYITITTPSGGPVALITPAAIVHPHGAQKTQAMTKLVQHNGSETDLVTRSAAACAEMPVRESAAEDSLDVRSASMLVFLSQFVGSGHRIPGVALRRIIKINHDYCRAGDS